MTQELQASLYEARKEAKMWKANHDHQVELKRKQAERENELRAELATTRAALEELQTAYDDLVREGNRRAREARADREHYIALWQESRAALAAAEAVIDAAKPIVLFAYGKAGGNTMSACSQWLGIVADRDRAALSAEGGRE